MAGAASAGHEVTRLAVDGSALHVRSARRQPNGPVTCAADSNGIAVCYRIPRRMSGKIALVKIRTYQQVTGDDLPHVRESAKSVLYIAVLGTGRYH
jgi:hypothetical protein